MSDQPDPRAQQIAALEAALKMPLPEATLAQITQDLRALREATAPTITAPHAERDVNIATQQTVNSTEGQVSNDGRIDGVAVGVNLGTIIYGRRPEEEERRRLVWYLDRLANKLYRMPLRGLEERLDQGKGIALPQVYVMLGVSSRRRVLDGGTSEKLLGYFEDNNLQKPPKADYHVDHALPTQAIVGISRLEHIDHGPLFSEQLSNVDLQSITASESLVIWRSFLATEVIVWHQEPWERVTRQERLPQQPSQQIVLLGDPGSGKSTFLRHLAWAMTHRGLDQRDETTALFGWEDNQWMLPIIISVRTLAGRLARDGISDAIVYAALRDEMQGYNIGQVDDLLSESLHRGAVLLLFDGLNEVPLDAIPGVTTDRHTTLRAVRAFAQMYPSAIMILTCRTRAFDESLHAELGWPVETLAPFTLGQIRHFVPAWYCELALAGQIEPTRAARLAQRLIDTIVTRPKLRAMAENPLLLTMMALVLYNKGELPRDRPHLYERILELLLGQWDKVRDGQSLAEAIGVPDWGSERIRPLLDRLSFKAHAADSSIDGRGRLARRDVCDALEQYLRQSGMRDDQAAAAAVRCLDYFNQRSGLLVPDDAQDSYTFAHLTLQEHCAGRALVLDPDATNLIMSHRADDRWREPIYLGLGVIQQTNPTLIDRVLSDLIDRDEEGRAKTVERWQRDLILAAEIGQDRDWSYLRAQRVNVDRLQRDLRRGLVELLGDKNRSLPVAERVRAGFLLGDLGDPRFPVTIEEWQRELAKIEAGDTMGYFCRVEARDYIIGSTDDDPDANDDEKPQHSVTFDTPFWIARYPITNVQWQVWVEEAGGQPSYFANDADLNRPNQPIVGVTWHGCNSFCAWLSEQLSIIVRLLTEQEWEAAARGGDARRYAWGDDWQGDRAATKEDQETRGQRYSVPVGCYPAGASPCGALDMAGNVWEWTANSWHSYPDAEKSFANENARVVRGGYWDSSPKGVNCGARDRFLPVDYFGGGGFRVVVAPHHVQ